MHVDLSETMDRRGVVWTWDNLIVPVLNGVGQQWSDSGRGIEVEHALSAAIQDALSGHVRAASAPVNNRSVLLACAPDEMHSLVLWAVAAGLAERRIGARILGASLPASALASAVQRLGPAVVFVWAQIPDTADPAILSTIPPSGRSHRPHRRAGLAARRQPAPGSEPRLRSHGHHHPDRARRRRVALGGRPADP